MSKKAFVATVKITIVVLAETEADAQQVAFGYIDEEDLHPEDFQVYPMDAKHFGNCPLPPNWEGDNFLYTSGDELVTFNEAWSRRYD